MKKMSLIAIFLVLALVTTQVQAYQLEGYKIDEELSSYLKTSFQDDVNAQYQEQQAENDENPHLLYAHATLDLVELRDNKYLFRFRKNKVRKQIFTTINKLAEATFKVIEYDPEANLNEYIWCIYANLNEDIFQYFGRKVTLQELFDFAIENKSITYDENTPIVKLLSIYNELNGTDNNLSNKKPSSFWQELSDWLHRDALRNSMPQGFEK